MDTDKLLSDWDRVTASALRPRTAPRDAGVRGTGAALRVAGGAVMVTLLVGALAWVAPRPGETQVGGVLASPSARPGSYGLCTVTGANGVPSDGWPASPLDHGVDGLHVVLWPNGVMEVPPDGIAADGSLSMKVVFYRDPSAAGRFAVTGRRTDGVSMPLRADIPDGYGESGVQATGLTFPKAGCWEITVTSGSATMTFGTQVRPAQPENPVGPRLRFADLVEQPAPPITGVQLDGTPVTVTLGGGRPALVDFTASWCAPCREEQQSLAAGRTTLEAVGVDLVTVLWRGLADDDARFVADHGITGTIIRDPDGTALTAYAGSLPPLSVLIDGDGVIHRFHPGPLTAGDLAVALRLLDSSPSPAAP